MFFRNKKSSKNMRLVFLFVLLYFFSNNLIYADFDNTNNKRELIPMGQVLQIDANLDSLLVRNQIKNSPFVIGDEILKINNIEIKNYGQLSDALNLSEKDSLDVYLKRNSNYLTVKASKKDLESLNLDNTLSGFATMTYIDPNTKEFGAVGHPISIGACKDLPINQGFISSTSDLSIKKSVKGNVGCLSAKKNTSIGQFKANTIFGIKGTVSNIDINKLKKYEIASLEEVKLGDAKIILHNDFCDKNEFDIQILSVDNQRIPQPKTFKIKITDPDLLKMTGGIVQGMSGTPIIQDDKIVGAISHAIENNPQNGYGVFIKWMLDN